MNDAIKPQDIINLRKKYGLSQRAFAQLLGIGEATMNRYENGVAPTKANANLIRAAMIPEFMAGCLEREGNQLSPKQRQSVEAIVYAEVTFNEEGEAMDVNEIYTLTLQQEVLNEKAWEVIAEASRLRAEALEDGNELLASVYEDVELQVAKAIPLILSNDSLDAAKLGEIKGQISGFQKLISSRLSKAA